MYSGNFREGRKPATLCNQICKQLVPVSGMPRPMPLPSVIFGQQKQQSAAMPVILCLDVLHSHGQEAKASQMGQLGEGEQGQQQGAVGSIINGKL